MNVFFWPPDLPRRPPDPPRHPFIYCKEKNAHFPEVRGAETLFPSVRAVVGAHRGAAQVLEVRRAETLFPSVRAGARRGSSGAGAETLFPSDNQPKPPQNNPRPPTPARHPQDPKTPPRPTPQDPLKGPSSLQIQQMWALKKGPQDALQKSLPLKQPQDPPPNPPQHSPQHPPNICLECSARRAVHSERHLVRNCQL